MKLFTVWKLNPEILQTYFGRKHKHNENSSNCIKSVFRSRLAELLRFCCFHLMSEERHHQGAVDVGQEEPDQNHQQVLHKSWGEGVSDQQELQRKGRRNCITSASPIHHPSSPALRPASPARRVTQLRFKLTDCGGSLPVWKPQSLDVFSFSALL